jgi:DNA-binding transcriptional LysR family regulator
VRNARLEMTILDLEALVAVVDTGSIVGAADRLHISQPAVTRRIQNLEEVLNAPLLYRDARPLQLTTAAKEVYSVAVRVLASVHELESRFGNGRPRPDKSGRSPRLNPTATSHCKGNNILD